MKISGVILKSHSSSGDVVSVSSSAPILSGECEAEEELDAVNDNDSDKGAEGLVTAWEIV